MPKHVYVLGVDRPLEFPDSMSDSEIHALVRATTASKVGLDQPRPNAADQVRNALQANRPWYERAATGFGESALSTLEGAKELFGEGDPADRAWLEYAQRRPFDLATAGGQVVGDIAQTAPAGALAGPGRVAAGAADIAASAAQGGLQAPVGEQDRLSNAAIGGIGAGLGQGVGAAMPALSPAAREMLGAPFKGVPLTPGQAFGGMARGIEERLTALPFIGTSVNKARRKAIDAWDLDVLKSVAPDPENLGKTDIGHKGLQKLSDQFNTAYRELGVLGNTPASWVRDQAQIFARSKADILDETQQAALNREVAAIGKRFGDRTLNLDDLSPVRAELRSLSKAAMTKGEYRLSQSFDELDDILQDSFYTDALLSTGTFTTEQVLAKKALDRQYAEYKVLQRAASYQGADEGVFTPSQLGRAVRAEDETKDKAATATGQALLQETANKGQQVFGTELPSPGPGTAEKVLFGAGALMEPAMLAAAPFAAGAMRMARAPIVRAGQFLRPDVVSPSLSQTFEKAIQEDQPTAAASIGGDLPMNLVAPLVDTEWFQRWLFSPVRQDRDTVQHHRVRLGNLTAGQDLSREQKAAVRELQGYLSSLDSGGF